MEMRAIRAADRASDRRSVLPAIAIAVAAAIGLAIQSLWLPIDADVSWLITVSERVLAGERLYVDIVEVNPPASVWLYVPLVWLAQLVGARPEATVALAFAAGAIVSVVTTMRLAARLRDPPPPLLLAAALSFVTLVLPMALFAQREHAALLLALPVLAALALLAEGRNVGRPGLIASGLAAGLVVVIKPYFLPAILFPALWAWWRRGSLSPFFPAIAAGAAAIALYGAAIFAFAPSYLDLVPMLSETYAAMRAAWWRVIVGPSLYPAICLGLVVLLRPRRIPSLSISWALGAVGFLIAAFVQGKNYPNHWLPQAGLALAAAVPVLALPGIARARVALVGTGLAVVALCEMYYWAIRPDPAVAAAIERVAPPMPTVIALSPQLTTGHPVTRNVGGRWVGSRAALFTASGARVAGLESKSAARAYRQDIDSFAADVARHRPSVVLVHPDSKELIAREPAIARAMADYRFAAAATETEIWLRRR